MKAATVPLGDRHVLLRTAAWYGDRPLELTFPPDWEVRVFAPRTPSPLTDAQIIEALERPINQLPIRQLAEGKSRPLVIVDDLNRPTPASRVMPHLLRHFEDAHILPDQVRILMATGTHGAPSSDALARKVGPRAASACRLLVHDDRRNLVKVGRTSLGTPVLVNREALNSDLMVGIGGVYPQHPHWFGGGSKLALGILGARSIARLHLRHRAMTSTYAIDTAFRRELDEIARMLGFNTSVSLHVDADRQVVRAVSGDHFAYYADAATFSRDIFSAPAPGDGDVVIANAYPVDVSVTFSVFKGTTPLAAAARSASRVLVTASIEGAGHHGLFPLFNVPRFHEQRQRIERIAMMKPREIGARVMSRVRSRLSGRRAPGPPVDTHRYPVLVLRSVADAPEIATGIPGMVLAQGWPDLLQRIRLQQGERRALKVVVYPCAPLQCLDLPAAVSRQPMDEG